MRLSGEFDRFFLASIFQLISSEELSGVLRLSSGSQNAKVYIHEGQVVSAPGGDNRRRLGEWLISDGVLTAEELPGLIAAALAAGCCLGTLLVGRGRLSVEKLTDCLKKQTRELVWDVFEWQGGTFAFEPGDVDVQSKIHVSLNAQEVVLDALRRFDEAEGPIEDDGPAADSATAERIAELIDMNPVGCTGDALPAAGAPPIRVLVVDDSRMVRKAVIRFLEGCGGITVVGEAADGSAAVRLNAALRPDVITMDVCMPVMDGLAALKRIMILHPKPVVMLSTLTRDGMRETFEALRLGAVDFVSKPMRNSDVELAEQFALLEKKIRLASRITRSSLTLLRSRRHSSLSPSPQCLRPGARLAAGATDEGGYRTLMRILACLQFQTPTAMVVATHCDAEPLGRFADYLTRFSRIPVLRPNNGEPVQANACYLTAGNERVTISRHEEGYRFSMAQRKGVAGPQAIPLMASVANILGPQAVGVALAGDVSSGIQGIRAIKDAGGTAVAQRPESCLCNRFVSEAIASRCVDAVMTEEEIGRWIGNAAGCPLVSKI